MGDSKRITKGRLWPNSDTHKHKARQAAGLQTLADAASRVNRLQSACLRKNAGISISSMPLLDSASTLAAAWLRALRHTLGVFRPS